MNHRYRRPPRLLVLGLVSLLFVLLVAACGSRDKPQSGAIPDERQADAVTAVAPDATDADVANAPQDQPAPTSTQEQSPSSAAANTASNDESATASPAASGASLDARLRTLIQQQGLTGDPSIGRDLPSIDDPIAQLGKLLFFTKALGGDKDSACVTCHAPTLGGGDDLSLPIGVGADNPDLLGPGRTHPSGHPTVPRNAPTTFNIAMWDQAIFHDGRIESLGKTPGADGADGQGIRTPEVPLGVADPNASKNLVAAQSRFPLTSSEEMRGFQFEAGNGAQAARDHLAARLGDYGAGIGELANPAWLAEFERAFNHKATPERIITEQYIAEAIGRYERSQVFINTPWKAYVQGDESALSESAKRGALLFFSPYEDGGANCAACHSGDFFTDEQFHVLAIPQIGPGKGDGPNGTDDFGRFRETGQFADLYAFRTPSLLNVEETGPWGHDGAYTTLEGIVRHHLNPAQAVATYDFSQLDPSIQTEHTMENTTKALAQLESNRKMGLLEPQYLALTDGQVADLVAFLRSLTDPCVTNEDCLAPWMLDENDPDPDGLLLRIAQTP